MVSALVKQTQGHQGLESFCQGVARNTQTRLPVVKSLDANESAQNQRHSPAVTQQVQTMAECAGG